MLRQTIKVTKTHMYIFQYNKSKELDEFQLTKSRKKRTLRG